MCFNISDSMRALFRRSRRHSYPLKQYPPRVVWPAEPVTVSHPPPPYTPCSSFGSSRQLSTDTQSLATSNIPLEEFVHPVSTPEPIKGVEPAFFSTQSANQDTMGMLRVPEEEPQDSAWTKMMVLSLGMFLKFARRV